MMKYLPLLFLITLIVACQTNPQEETPALENSNTDFALQATANPELQYEHLHLYPILAEESFVNTHLSVANLNNLKEGIANERFRITEKKPYGRFDDTGAVNSLTIQNKSKDTVFIMAGDVVQGGKQDRVIAQDLVVPPKTITDIHVFCVEQGRWTYQDEGNSDEQIAENNKKIFAFTGYYNVASHEIRKTVKGEKNQEAIWQKVGEVTALNNATNATSAYTGLEKSEDFTAQRDKYLRFFDGKVIDMENVIGMVAVSGNQILGADIFAHPNLFKKQYEALLHSYVTEAITNGKPVKVSEAEMQAYAKKLKAKYLESELGSDAKFGFEGIMIHFTDI